MSAIIGKLLAQAEYRMSAESLAYCAGVAGVMDKCASAKRLLIATAATAMRKMGRANTAPYYHLEQVLALTQDGSWTPHAEDVYQTVMRPLELGYYEGRPMLKSAAPMLFGGLGLAGKGLGYAALGGGAAAGLLMHALSKHTNQDEAEVESMKHQRDYYDKLTGEIEESMRREYPYEQQKKKQTKKA